MKQTSSVDLLLINAPGKAKVYQSLANEYTAIEPPIWALLIASYIRNMQRSVTILDAEALNLTYDQTVSEIVSINPTLAVFVVYGQQPSASTQCMPAAGNVHSLLKKTEPSISTLFLGTHPSSLPELTLKEFKSDFVCFGEGPGTILEVLIAMDNHCPNFDNIAGLCFEKDGFPFRTRPMALIDKLDSYLDDMAWDLLPMDKYRAHNWHCWDDINQRQPYASLYTSLGCPYKCSFCCINATFGKSGIRYWSPEWTLKQIDNLVNNYGVKNIKIADEMFVLNPHHVLGICEGLITRNYDLNIWAYARVDTIQDRFLEKLRAAGFRWLGIGVESSSQFVRSGVDKGRFNDESIIPVIKKVQSSGINVGANYIFGLPDDTGKSMQQTLDLALELNTEWANFYSAMAYPGSPLHSIAKKNGYLLPEDEDGPGWLGYSQHSYECLPLPTEYLSAKEVLSFRDNAFDRYFTNSAYLEMMESKFGGDVVAHLSDMTSLRLKRKLFEI